MYELDLKNRRIIITNDAKQQIIINEFDKVKRKFLPNTQDTYECILILKEVPEYDMNMMETETKVTKPFIQRVGNSYWLMEFVEEEYEYN